MLQQCAGQLTHKTSEVDVLSVWWLHVQLLVATGQGNVAYLEVEGNKLKQVAHHKLEVEVACLDLTPLGQFHPACDCAPRNDISFLQYFLAYSVEPLAGLGSQS